MDRVKINPPFIRLDSFLKLCGTAATGGHAKVLIQSGRILVDGEICLMRGKKLRGGETVMAENQSFEVFV